MSKFKYRDYDKKYNDVMLDIDRYIAYGIRQTMTYRDIKPVRDVALNVMIAIDITVARLSRFMPSEI